MLHIHSIYPLNLVWILLKFCGQLVCKLACLICNEVYWEAVCFGNEDNFLWQSTSESTRIRAESLQPSVFWMLALGNAGSFQILLHSMKISCGSNPGRY